MSNLIIPGRNPVPESERPHAPSWKTYASEMDDPALKNPRLMRAISDLEKRVLSKSHSAHVEDAEREFLTNYAARRPYQWDGQRRWMGRESEEMRLVRIMHPYAFIALLNRGGVKADIKNDYWDVFSARSIRVWLNPFIGKAKFQNETTGEIREVSSGLVGVNAWQLDEALGGWVAKTLTALQYPYGPEWSLMRFDEYNVPTKEKYRGWRTALLALIRAGILTEAEAHSCFGQPVENAASEFYRAQLFDHRRVMAGLCSY